MSKKLIMVTAVAGLASFAGAFGFTWASTTVLHGRPDVGQPADVNDEYTGALPEPDADPLNVAGVLDSKTKRNLTERQLKDLVHEVRRRIREYEDKLRSLNTREQRLQTARETLKKDIEGLRSLQVELASATAGLRDQRDKLEKSRLRIAAAEKENLISIAATYDKMDSASASKILADMSKSQNSNSEDAVKILYYMTERTKAKLLAELASAEPALASYFCRRLKQVEQ